jgi:hypothetical protein
MQTASKLNNDKTLTPVRAHLLIVRPSCYESNEVLGGGRGFLFYVEVANGRL